MASRAESVVERATRVAAGIVAKLPAAKVAAVTIVLGAPWIATGPAGAQVPVERVLTFEASDADGGLHGWSGGPDGTVHIDSAVVHGGRYAGRLERAEGAPGGSSAFSYTLPVEFTGETVALRGWLRTQDVQGAGGFAALWLRQDGRSGYISIDNMQDQGLDGTTDWAEFTVSIELDQRATRLVFGALLPGRGTLWVDDLQLLVDDAPLDQAPPLVREPTAMDLDTEFDEGSGIESGPVTSLQVENLELLARVWGFLKYHHPRVTSGQTHWDYELFRALPGVLEAASREEARSVIAAWAGGLGPAPACEPCATPPSDVHFEAAIDWIHDTELLGAELSAFLEDTYRNRTAEPEQAYVWHVPNVGNPDFNAEQAYAELDYPDAGYRLLGLFRFWNIIEYWFPYRDILDDDWATVLQEYIPRMTEAPDRASYELALMEVIARVDDTHANLWSSLAVRPPVGPARVPVRLRPIEGEPVVVEYAHAEVGPASGLRIGDVIERVDGAPVDSLFEAWQPYYAASNESTRLRDMTANVLNGPEGPVTISGRRAGGPFTVEATRIPRTELDPDARWNDRRGETFLRLDEDVAYLKLSSVKQAEVPQYLEGARGADVLVIDIRNYPSEFMPFALGRHLVTEPTEFVRFTRAVASNPGTFVWGPPLSLEPLEPRFEGRVVILVDEVSVSQAEYTTMAFRVAPGALVVGSTTAAADGNVSPIPLPGGLRAMITGIGVFYPDDTPTQRVGIIPDVVVWPTIGGIREGRDEVLEAGVSRALGRPWRAPQGGG